MKKIISVVLSGLILLTSAITASADTVSQSKGSSKKDIVTVYMQNDYVKDTYNIELEWGSMQFNYKAGIDGDWHPETHTSEVGTEGVWSCSEGANKIKLTNKSNQNINITYVLFSAPDGINFEFRNSNNELLGTDQYGRYESEIDAPTNQIAHSEEVHLNLSGYALNAGSIGTLYVSIY